MRKILAILAVVGLAMGATAIGPGSANAAIRAVDDELVLQKIGNRLRVLLNGKVLFKKLKLKGGQYHFKVSANKFLKNDKGKKKRMVAFDAVSKVAGIKIKVKKKKNRVQRIALWVKRKVVGSKRPRRQLSDYVLQANDPEFDSAVVNVKVASPS